MIAPAGNSAPTIGLVGVGNWGRHILRDLKCLGATVHAVARSPQSIDNARAGGAASIGSIATGLPRCNAYVVASTVTSHLDVIDALLPRGRPIYVEKPLSNDVKRVRALPAEARRLVFVMHKWRYHPGVAALTQIASSREFGPVTGIATTRVGFGVNHEDVDPIWVLAPHDLSILLHILGELPEAVSGYADPGARRPGDGGLWRLRGRGGIPVQIEISSNRVAQRRSIALFCRAAIVELNDGNYDRLALRRRDDPPTGEPRYRTIPGKLPLLAELEAFLAHVAGGPPPMSSLAEEIAILERIVELRKMAGIAN
jgi:predicted dehydrogenase